MLTNFPSGTSFENKNLSWNTCNVYILYYYQLGNKASNLDFGIIKVVYDCIINIVKMVIASKLQMKHRLLRPDRRV